MKAGDLVKWTFAKSSPNINRENICHMGILLYPEDLPVGSWVVLLASGGMVHADITEIEVLSEARITK